MNKRILTATNLVTIVSTLIHAVTFINHWNTDRVVTLELVAFTCCKKDRRKYVNGKTLRICILGFFTFSKHNIY